MKLSLACLGLLGTSASFVGCVPSFDVDLSEVAQPEVIAVRAEPAEAEPGQSVTLTALVVGSAEELPEVEFGLCNARRDLAELGPVAPECLRRGAKAVQGLGHGLQVGAVVPEEACNLFGPKRPEAKLGEPAGRPADPDLTGGYYQPVIARLEDEAPTLGAVRLACGLQRADREQVEEYNLRFQPNRNPQLSSLELRIDGKWIEVRFESEPGSSGTAQRDAGLLDAGTPDAGSPDAGGPDAGTADPETAGAGTVDAGEPSIGALQADAGNDESPQPLVHVRQGQEVALRVNWESCPRKVSSSKDEPGPACGGAEPYLIYNHDTRQLDERREQLVLTWYASAGEIASHRTAPDSPNDARDANTWRAPLRPSEVQLWVVLRDGRGGVGWGSVKLAVR